jgi:hypothetical protein
MVIDLAAHHRCSRITVSDKIGRVGGGRVHHHGKRGFQRVGQVAGVGARFFGLLLRMGEQEVDFLHQRLDFERQRLVHARAPPSRIAAMARRTRRKGPRP